MTGRQKSWKKSNKIKAEQLGMSHGTANNRLRKSILFKFIQLLELNDCWQCNRKIENANELSIEHITPWLHSEDPVNLYFDLDNIAFSHLSCNISASRNPHAIEYDFKSGKQYCCGCKKDVDTLKFPSYARNKKSKICTKCASKKQAERRERTGKR